MYYILGDTEDTMFEVRDGLHYNDDHVWISVKDNEVVFGMTDFAQHEIGELVYIELPQIGDCIVKGEEIGAMESVKSVEPIYAPISGTIVKVNTSLDDSPKMVNDSPYDDGWMAVVEISDPSEVEGMMDADAYRAKTA